MILTVYERSWTFIAIALLYSKTVSWLPFAFTTYVHVSVVCISLSKLVSDPDYCLSWLTSEPLLCADSSNQIFPLHAAEKSRSHRDNWIVRDIFGLSLNLHCLARMPPRRRQPTTAGHRRPAEVTKLFFPSRKLPYRQRCPNLLLHH